MQPWWTSLKNKNTNLTEPLNDRLDSFKFPLTQLLLITQTRLLKIGDGLPLILPPKSGGYWIDPPLDRHVETSPSFSQGGFGLESYDIMEKDSEAKVYQEFFRHRVSDHFFFILLIWTTSNTLHTHAFLSCLLQYHHSFTACDPSLGHLVLSVCLEEEENRLRVILRCVFCEHLKCCSL